MEDCTYKDGRLPECAPLGIAYVPMQQSAEPAYDSAEALSRGTLFPGLDLPFMNIVNSIPEESTPLRELMALCFVINELGLYLDTHKTDSEAFAALRSCLKLYETGYKKYVSLYGPISRADLISEESYTWLDRPWPWELDKSSGV